MPTPRSSGRSHGISSPASTNSTIDSIENQHLAPLGTRATSTVKLRDAASRGVGTSGGGSGARRSRSSTPGRASKEHLNVTFAESESDATGTSLSGRDSDVSFSMMGTSLSVDHTVSQVHHFACDSVEVSC